MSPFFEDIANAMADDQDWMADTSRPPDGFNDAELPAFMFVPATVPCPSTVPPTPDKPAFGGGFNFGRGFGSADFSDILASAEKVRSHNRSRHGVIPETPNTTSGSGSGASCMKSHFSETRTKHVDRDEVKKRISFGGMDVL